MNLFVETLPPVAPLAPADLPHLLALQLVEGVGPVLARALVAHCGGPRQVWARKPQELMAVPGLGVKTAKAIAQQADAALRRAELQVARAAQEGVRVRTYLDADWPPLLAAHPFMPLALFQKGETPLGQAPTVGIVGTRSPTDYGRRQAARFAEALARQGVCIVSGLAYGIDAEAHKATLAAGGATVGVLGHGLHRVYPHAHAKLAAQMVAQGGALLTEYLHGVEPEPQHFPQRNRIIAGLCSAVVVIEAAAKGGALITAREAFDIDREVFAVPGPVEARTSAGCHALIQQQVAQLCTDPEEVAAALALQLAPGPPTAPAGPPPGLAEGELAIWTALGDAGCGLDELALRLERPVGPLVSELLALEFRGVLRQLPGRRFTREGA